MGEVVSMVGPTGSGKTTLINDMEPFADANTPTGRRILINGALSPQEYGEDPARHPITLITPHTTFLSDLAVAGFLSTHARIRSSTRLDRRRGDRTPDFANKHDVVLIDKERQT
jgi:ABC-type lipoprotein export system ATPase subunit